jgi:Ca-activated chloride channel homolog
MGSSSVTSLLKRVRPKHARGAILAGALAAAFLGFVLEPDSPPPRVLAIQYVISPDAESLLSPLVESFNDERHESHGKVIEVGLASESSGDAAHDMGDALRPVMWTPASSAWAELVTKRWIRIGVRSLVWSPEVVAIWKTEADRLNLGSSIRYADLAALIASRELAFGHTDPNSSTSGLFALLSEYSFFAQKRPADLSLDDVAQPSVRAGVRNLEWNTVHYVDIARMFADEWCEYGVGFASAAYMQETTLVDFNKRCETQLRAVYVTDFPFVADYPYLVLAGPWVSEEQKEAAGVFGAWLENSLAADPKLAESGFRRGKQIVPDEESGAVPTQPTAPAPPLPNAGLLRTIQRGWSELRRPGDVMLVVDESQHMAAEGKEELAKDALQDFLACPGEGKEADDRVGLITFGGSAPQSVRTRVALADFDESRSQLAEEIASLAARGGGTLWDGVEQALDTVDLEGAVGIRTIIVMAQGSDDGSSTSPSELEGRLRGLIVQGRPVQVLVVAYGPSERELALLQDRLVTPSYGRYFKKKVSDIAEVTKFICAFQ